MWVRLPPRALRSDPPPPADRPLTRLLAAALVAACLVLAWWAFLFARQRALLFPAPSANAAPPPPADAVPVWLDTSGGWVEAWYLPPLGPASGDPAPLLLFAHGNAELIDYWPGEFTTPRRWGMAVLLVEYPGYGRSGGRPSEAAIAETVLAAYDWAAGRPDVDSARIVAYGRSLGGGAATLLARSRGVAALVLESTFTSVHAFARRVGAPALLVRDRFDNLAALPDVTAPILILHGTHDRIVPAAHAHALRAAQPSAELVLLPCGHNDCAMPWAPIGRFLRRHAIVAPDSTA